MTHTGLARHTRGDHDDVCAGQSLLESIVGRQVANDLCGCGDVGQIGGNSGGVDDIEECELRGESETRICVFRWRLTSFTRGLFLRRRERG